MIYLYGHWRSQLRRQVKEIALRITGADDGEIEADTPLMEAGLTSNSVPTLAPLANSDVLEC